MNKDYIESILNIFPEVAWDRYIDDESGYIFYGWIDREDSYKDFMVIEMDKDGGYYFITSSAKYSAEFLQRINPDSIHSDCIRIESNFEPKNMIRIKKDSITCPQCQMTSYHPEDIKQKYCGNCHQFHSEMNL